MKIIYSKSEFEILHLSTAAQNSKNVTDVTDLRTQPRVHNLGFVPTMGALHQGHISLVERARRDCNQVCVSIFVNPLQFGPNEDFSKYPRTIDADLELLEQAGANIVYLPEIADIYPELSNHHPNQQSTRHPERSEGSPNSAQSLGIASPATLARNDINTSTKLNKIYADPELANRLCGLNRPGHFDGVCTVVKRLFDIVQPQRAYFGEKDYQQLMIIREMVERLELAVEIIACPIMREPDGLAMSSRNRYLNAEERKLALMLYAELLSLRASHCKERSDEAILKLESSGFKVDYLENHWNRIFIAAKLGNTRLIDNIAL